MVEGCLRQHQTINKLARNWLILALWAIGIGKEPKMVLSSQI